jgi:hypothetical protein
MPDLRALLQQIAAENQARAGNAGREIERFERIGGAAFAAGQAEAEQDSEDSEYNEWWRGKQPQVPDYKGEV